MLGVLDTNHRESSGLQSTYWLVSSRLTALLILPQAEAEGFPSRLGALEGPAV